MYRLHPNGMLTDSVGHVINAPQVPRFTKHLALFAPTTRSIQAMHRDDVHDWEDPIEVLRECQDLADRYQRIVTLHYRDKTFDFHPHETEKAHPNRKSRRQ